jgi:hypothetical protein
VPNLFCADFEFERPPVFGSVKDGTVREHARIVHHTCVPLDRVSLPIPFGGGGLGDPTGVVGLLQDDRRVRTFPHTRRAEMWLDVPVVVAFAVAPFSSCLSPGKSGAAR